MAQSMQTATIIKRLAPGWFIEQSVYKPQNIKKNAASTQEPMIPFFFSFNTVLYILTLLPLNGDNFRVSKNRVHADKRKCLKKIDVSH